MKSLLGESSTEVFIKDIPTLQWGKNRNNTFIRSSQFALQCLGEEYHYDYLMGISGTAFRTHFHPDWCPSSVDATVGYDVSRNIFKTLGIQCVAAFVDTNNFFDIRNYFQKVKEHIQQGIPIIAINLKVSPDWGLITGYYKNKPGMLCRTYYDKSEKYSDAERAPWVSFFISKKEDKKMVAKEIFLKSMERLITLGKIKKYEEYFNGFAAYEYWISKLEDAKASERNKQFYENMNINSIIFHFLLDARLAAYCFFKNYTPPELLNNGDKIINSFSELTDLMQHTCENILPSIGDTQAEWSNETISQEVIVLKEMAHIEKEIHAEIEKKLKV